MQFLRFRILSSILAHAHGGRTECRRPVPSARAPARGGAADATRAGFRIPTLYRCQVFGQSVWILKPACGRRRRDSPRGERASGAGRRLLDCNKVISGVQKTFSISSTGRKHKFSNVFPILHFDPILHSTLMPDAIAEYPGAVASGFRVASRRFVPAVASHIDHLNIASGSAERTGLNVFCLDTLLVSATDQEVSRKKAFLNGTPRDAAGAAKKFSLFERDRCGVDKLRN
ncbi:hypothetical protein EVAR_67131_1 [Eumeta japonica]|uniref:Uncharacterized protein n=1 Tax=Eumeta variegata TaxID=151549 RepID=A0A4C1ZWW2_EUMVA|nr:hypothetical protein EVAR_67131_1 [Eumeta japonica]